MNYTNGYLIVDENGKYVVGYVKEDNKFRYIAYSKNDKCALRPLKTIENAVKYIEQLEKIANDIGEEHQFSYIEI